MFFSLLFLLQLLFLKIFKLNGLFKLWKDLFLELFNWTLTIHCWPAFDYMALLLFLDLRYLWLLSFSEILHLFWFFPFRIKLNAKLIEKLLKMGFLNLFLVVFINLGAGFVSDFEMVYLICDVIADMGHIVVNPSSSQESIVGSFWIDVDP